MRFAIWQHAGKGGYLRQRLLDAGHTETVSVAETELLLVDCDWRWAHPRPELIRTAKAAGAKVALYPHGGQPTVFVYDGLTEPDPAVDLRLEHGPGSIEIARLLAVELKQEAPGWLYSPTRPFQPVEKPKRLLFAPQHPNMETLLNGRNGHDPGPKLNQAVYRQLLTLGYELTVSLVGPAWKNGVYPHPRARLVWNPQMLYQHSQQLVEEADVVVAAGTVAAAAVAAGKPTVMFAQGNHADYLDGRYQQPHNTSLYDGLLRYPLDVGTGDLDTLIATACAGDKGAAEWRTRFVGDDGTDAAVRLLEQLTGIKTTETRHVSIAGVTARSTGN